MTEPGRRRRRWPIVLGAVVIVLAIVAVAGYWSVRPLLRTGTGYAAHSNCAVVNLAGRENPETDLPPNPLVPYLLSQQGQRSATVTVLGALAWQTAWYTPGYGCTLGEDPEPYYELDPVASSPLPTALDPALDQALAAAFGDELGEEERETLGTRAVVVLRDGEVVAERYAPGFDADTRQLGWSMTKSVTNLLTGRVLQESTWQLSLDKDHLREEWTDERADITVDDLLRMTSGLAWDETYDLGTPITQMLYGEPDMAKFVASQPATHTPGTFQQYSSGSTTLLCSVLQDAIGYRSSPQLPHELLFEPLGLSSAVLEPDASGTPVCGSYLWATPLDWARIGQFVLDDGVVDGQRLLPEGWLDESTTVKPVAETDSPNFAASWWVNELADGSLINAELPADTFWASGHDGRRLYVVPSEDLVVVRLGFSPEAEDIRADQLVADVIAAG